MNVSPTDPLGPRSPLTPPTQAGTFMTGTSGLTTGATGRLC